MYGQYFLQIIYHKYGANIADSKIVPLFFYNADLNISLTSSTIFTPIFVEQIRTLVLHMLTKQGN